VLLTNQPSFGSTMISSVYKELAVIQDLEAEFESEDVQ